MAETIVSQGPSLENAKTILERKAENVDLNSENTDRKNAQVEEKLKGDSHERSIMDASKAKGGKRKGISGFMLFVKTNRPAIVEELGGKGAPVEVTRLAGEKWRALTDDERTEWNNKGKEYVTESDSRKDEEAKDNKDLDADRMNVPLSKVREIAKLDPEVHNITGQAVRLLANAVQLFAKELAIQALESGDKKRIRLIDVHHIVHSNDPEFGFLSQDFSTPATLLSKEMKAQKQKSRKVESIDKKDVVSNKNRISSYFGRE